jgi:hypothetical protein
MVLDISQKVPSIATSGGGLGILTLIQVFDGSERYGTFSFFETIPLSGRNPRASRILKSPTGDKRHAAATKGE